MSTVAAPTPTAPAPSADIRLGAGERPARLDSVDILRGLVIVLMAIDHVRVYSGLPAGGPTAGIFLTRWVTHFCAPVFVFLAGTGAFLNGRKIGSAALARYLVTRGLALVVLELTLIRYAWNFNFAYADFTLAGVIWMLGWCMVLLAALVRLSSRTVGILGVAIVVGQAFFALPPRLLPESTRQSLGWVWEFIYPAGLQTPDAIAVLYVIVPWIGVMAAGYGFGPILLREAHERRTLCLRLGLGMTAAFLVIGVAGALSAGGGEGEQAPFIFQVLNQRKYPASVPFLLMTLGPSIVLLPFIETARSWLARAMRTFGRVPMFYYLLHIPLIHVSALAVGMIKDGAMHHEWYATAPFTSVPEDHRWSLGLLYLVFIVDVALLYVACRWFERVKARSSAPALRYL